MNNNKPLYSLTQKEFFEEMEKRFPKLELDEKKHLAEDEPFIKIDEVCKIFNVSKVTVFTWIKKGIIPCHRMNSRLYFKRSEVLEAMKKNI